LRARDGVVDVSFGARTGKKGRPLADFRVLARPSSLSSLVQACFSETSTLGVRVRDDRRQILRRSDVRAGDVSVKVAQRPGGVRTGKAAHDDVADKATLDSRRSARAAAEHKALENDE
jgi:uncharacterized protein (DUF111 family)